MAGIPEGVLRRVNKDTVISYGFLDMDAKEFVTREELMKRFPSEKDYVLRSDYFNELNNEHQVLFAMSKQYFTAKESESLSRELSFNN